MRTGWASPRKTSQQDRASPNPRAGAPEADDGANTRIPSRGSSSVPKSQGQVSIALFKVGTYGVNTISLKVPGLGSCQCFMILTPYHHALTSETFILFEESRGPSLFIQPQTKNHFSYFQ